MHRKFKTRKHNQRYLLPSGNELLEISSLKMDISWGEYLKFPLILLPKSREIRFYCSSKRRWSPPRCPQMFSLCVPTPIKMQILITAITGLPYLHVCPFLSYFNPNTVKAKSSFYNKQQYWRWLAELQIPLIPNTSASETCWQKVYPNYGSEIDFSF